MICFCVHLSDVPCGADKILLVVWVFMIDIMQYISKGISTGLLGFVSLDLYHKCIGYVIYILGLLHWHWGDYTCNTPQIPLVNRAE